MESSSAVAADNVGLQLKFPNFRNTTGKMNKQITLVGDSYLRNGVVGLTKAIGHIRDGVVWCTRTPSRWSVGYLDPLAQDPHPSAGAMVYKNPISLFDPETNTASSFSTNFTFSITTPRCPRDLRDGFAFFFSPNNPSSSGFFPGPLGLLTTNNFVAVEFDTRPDPDYLTAINFRDNFIRLNINNSLKSPEVSPYDRSYINLACVESITAWIDYKSDCNSLDIFLSHPLSDLRSSKPPGLFSPSGTASWMIYPNTSETTSFCMLASPLHHNDALFNLESIAGVFIQLFN